MPISDHHQREKMAAKENGIERKWHQMNLASRENCSKNDINREWQQKKMTLKEIGRKRKKQPRKMAYKENGSK